MPYSVAFLERRNIFVKEEERKTEVCIILSHKSTSNGVVTLVTNDGTATGRSQSMCNPRMKV